MIYYTIWGGADFLDDDAYYDCGVKYTREEIIDILQKLSIGLDSTVEPKVVNGKNEGPHIDIKMRTSIRSADPADDGYHNLYLTIYPEIDVMDNLKDLASAIEYV